MAEHLREAETRLAALAEAIESGKGKKELRSLILKAQNALTPNQAFVAQQFDEHMEATVEKAKIEVNAYAQGAITRAGLVALRGGAPPIEMLGDGRRGEPCRR